MSSVNQRDVLLQELNCLPRSCLFHCRWFHPLFLSLSLFHLASNCLSNAFTALNSQAASLLSSIVCLPLDLGTSVFFLKCLVESQTRRLVVALVFTSADQERRVPLPCRRQTSG